MKSLWGVLLAVALLIGVSACAAGSSETDHEASVLADAIAYPHQTSARDYALAAMATHLGQSGALAVLVANDVAAGNAEDVSAHLEFRIHHDGYQSGFTTTDPVTACYSVDFNYYQAVNGPSRIDCPANAKPLNLVPQPPSQIPSTFDQPLQAILAALPATTTEADVRAALTHGMPAIAPDPGTNLSPTPPALDISIRGNDIGVSYRTDDPKLGIECLFGSRLGGTVKVWHPYDVQPGELTCSADEALSQEGMTPSH